MGKDKISLNMLNHYKGKLEGCLEIIDLIEVLWDTE